ncbi:hypothetical protein ACHAXR_006320 [Thalassiosira sp. AJA248-18]
MCPEAADIVEAIMSAMGVKEEPVSSMLNVAQRFLLRRLHVAHDDSGLRKKPWSHHGLQEVSKAVWEVYLMDACRQWPEAASYLQVIAKNKHR